MTRPSRFLSGVVLLACLEFSAGFAKDPGDEGPARLRVDGLYRSEWKGKKDDGYWMFLRFYKDGTVLSVSSSGTPSDLRKWFKKDKRGMSKGTYEQDGRHVTFSTTSGIGKVNYKGTITGGQIHVDIHSEINGNRDRYAYSFIPWPKAEKEEAERP